MVIIENKMNLASHSYCIVLDIKKLKLISGNCSKKTRMLNFYDNKNGNRWIWQRACFVL